MEINPRHGMDEETLVQRDPEAGQPTSSTRKTTA